MSASIAIYSSPVYAYPGSPSDVSNWLTVNNPLIWKITHSSGAPPAGYQIQVIIKNESAVEVYKGYYVFGTDNKCVIRLDAVLKELVFLENTFTYNLINKKEERLSHKFNIDIQGSVVVTVWEAGTQTISPFDLYCIHAVRQIGCIYGANMADYVTLTDGSRLAKFMTFFDKPRYWEGYPWSIDFLWQYFGGTSFPLRIENTVSENGTVSADSNSNLTGLETIDEGHVHHLKIAGSYASSIKEIRIRVAGQMPAIRTLTETKTIALQTFDNRNTLYLRWINEIAGTEHWLFNINQIKKISITDQMVAKLDVLDLVTATGTHQARSSRKLPMYSIGTEPLTENEWDVLSQQLGGTIYCQVYDQTLAKWFNALVVPADYERNTKSEPHKIEFNIILPEIFNQSL